MRIHITGKSMTALTAVALVPLSLAACGDKEESSTAFPAPVTATSAASSDASALAARSTVTSTHVAEPSGSHQHSENRPTHTPGPAPGAPTGDNSGNPGNGDSGEGDADNSLPPTEPGNDEHANGPNLGEIPPGMYFTGLATQKPNPDMQEGTGESQYEVQIRYAGDFPNYTYQEVYYPDLGCAGYLEGSGTTYTELITDGDCDSGGTWTFEAHSGLAASGSYTPPSHRYTVDVSMMATSKP